MSIFNHFLKLDVDYVGVGEVLVNDLVREAKLSLYLCSLVLGRLLLRLQSRFNRHIPLVILGLVSINSVRILNLFQVLCVGLFMFGNLIL